MILGKVVREQQRRLGVGARGRIGFVGVRREVAWLRGGFVDWPSGEDLEGDFGETIAKTCEETERKRGARNLHRFGCLGCGVAARLAARLEAHDAFGVDDVSAGVRATGPDHHERPFAVRVTRAGEIASVRWLRDRTRGLCPECRDRREGGRAVVRHPVFVDHVRISSR